MNWNHFYPALSALVLVLTMAACVPSGQATHPAPLIDPNALSTAVAGTAQAAAQQTAAVRPEAPPMTGTTIEKLQEGTTRYADYEGGFEVTFPAGWLAARPDAEEFDAALAKEGAVNSMLHDQMIADLAGYEANYDRLYAYILRPDIKPNVMLGFSKLVWDSQTSLSIDSAAMDKLVRDLEAAGGIPGFRADTAQIHEDRPVKMMEIGGRWILSDEGGTVPFYSTFIFFKPTSSTGVRITFSFLQDYQAQISADVKSIMDSIRVIEPQR